MDHDQLKERIENFVKENKAQILRDLAALLAVPSTKGQSAPGAPFGLDPRRALDTALTIAERMGLNIGDGEGYMGWAELKGRSERQLALAAHLDVVPAGEGWTFPPFALTRHEGFLVGRGVADDKGPAVLMLYVAKFFKELSAETGKQLPYTLRVLLGCNEETGMGCVRYYTKHYPMPDFCFTPDATFPVNYGEKGGMRATLISTPITEGRLVEFSGGETTNAVPGKAEALVRATEQECPVGPGISVATEGKALVRLTARGKASHACEPEGAVNAIGLLVNYLLEHNLCSPEERPFLQMQQKLLANTDGSSIGIAAKDEYFTPLTCIGGVVSLEEGKIHQSVDIRFPTTQTAAKIERTLRDLVEPIKGEYCPGYVRSPFLIDPQSLPVRICVRAYEEVTGRRDELLTTSGGTYAHNFEHAICFGMEQPVRDYPAWVGGMHAPNEGVPEEWLFQSLKIYLLAVADLMDSGAITQPPEMY